MNFHSFFTLLFEDLSSKLPILLKQFPNENEKSIEQASEADPTNNKKFITWILKLKTANTIRLPEDASKIKEALSDFLRLSNTDKWKADKNIMTYKTYGALAKTVDSFKDITHIKIDKPLSENDKRIPIKTIGDITVYKIIDKETLMHWSQEPIKWCVKDESYAKNYLRKGPLFMFFKDEKPYVLCHFETGQIKDQWDNAIDETIAQELYPFLKNAFKNFKMDEDAEEDFDVFLKLTNITEEDKRYIILGKHIVHEDGSITCEGNVNLMGNNYTELPFKFREVKGYFNCARNILTTLKGCPEIVGKGFTCSQNQLTSLEGGPRSVKGTFDCSYNNLTTLKGGPQIVGLTFECFYNKLTSLVGSPEIIPRSFCCQQNNLTTLDGGPRVVQEHFYCYNNELTSLEGGPRVVGGRYYCQNNKLTTLKGSPKIIEGDFLCTNNELTSLEGGPETVWGSLYCANNKLTSLDGRPESVTHIYYKFNPISEP